MRHRTTVGLAAFFLLLASAGPAAAQGVTNLKVSGNEVTGRIDLPGGYLADLRLTFESVSYLDLNTLHFSAEVINPLDLVLLSRLPGEVTIPVGFPVLLRIQPTAASHLTFRGMYTLELHTDNLAFLPTCPFRGFKAPAGGKFEEVTQTMGVGSYRTRKGGSQFSEFLIAADLRPIDTVITGKYDDLDDTLQRYASQIEGSAYGQLVSLLASSHNAYEGGRLGEAVTYIEAFVDTVKANSATNIPDTWKANSTKANVAGALRVAAGTLRFSLLLKENDSL